MLNIYPSKCFAASRGHMSLIQHSLIILELPIALGLISRISVAPIPFRTDLLMHLASIVAKHGFVVTYGSEARVTLWRRAIK